MRIISHGGRRKNTGFEDMTKQNSLNWLNSHIKKWKFACLGRTMTYLIRSVVRFKQEIQLLMSRGSTVFRVDTIRCAGVRPISVPEIYDRVFKSQVSLTTFLVLPGPYRVRGFQ